MSTKIFSEIQISNINLENTFYSFCYPNNLAYKFDKNGDELYYPPIILEKKSVNYNVVEGLDRVNYLKSLGEPKINAFIITNATPVELFRMGIFYTQTYKSLNLIEKSIIIDKLISLFKQDERTTANEYLPIIKEKPAVNLVKSLLELNKLSDTIKKYIVEQRFTLSFAKSFCNFTFEEQELIYKWIEKLKLGVNEVKYFLESLNFLSGRDSTCVKNILNGDLFTELLSNNTESINSLKKKFQEVFLKLRFPDYKAHTDKIKNLIKSFKLEPNWKILPPKNLEGDGIDLIFHIKNEAEYAMVLNKLKVIYDNHSIENLFKLL
ncbi:MAG: hypothetical protein OEV44_10990 [Spirochaetota bacterium]|nr:hypothetical protein [Spirochaetota bacterium]